MTDHEATAFHDDSFRLYFRAWREPDYRGELEMGIPEAAYHALAHAGMLERLVDRRPGSGLEQLLDLPQEERARLVRDACEFAADFAVPRHFERFFAQDVLDTDELAEIEGALIQRDEFDAALMAADQVVNEFLASDDDLQTQVAGALDAARRFDDRLSQRPDILAVATRIVADSTDPEHYGAWLVKARQLDENFFEPTLLEFLPANENGRQQWAPDALIRLQDELLPERTGRSSPDYALAAGAGDAWSPLIDRLASEATDEVSQTDYRNAWAHFLAATYRGTTRRAEWRNKFVQLASGAGSLSDDWRERHRRAEELQRDRDWERRYSGEAAYRLEPRPIKNRGELLDWLSELTELTGSR